LVSVATCRPLSSRQLCPRVQFCWVLGSFEEGESTKMNFSQSCWLVSQLVIHSPLTDYAVYIASHCPLVRFLVRFLWVEINLQEPTRTNHVG